MTAWPESQLADVVKEAKPGFASGENPTDGVFQYRMNNLRSDGRFDFSKKRRVSKDTKKLDSYLLIPGDVLFNATNSPDLVGKSAFFDGHSEPAVFSNHFIRLRPDGSRLDGRFLARWLQLQFHRRLFRSRCKQWVNQATFSRDALLSLNVPVPPIEEQRRIAGPPRFSGVQDRGATSCSRRRRAGCGAGSWRTSGNLLRCA
jgi:type I restriction enzyme S subunit